MRPKHPHAAESGVGKHTARESERAQSCAAGKERVANAHPQRRSRAISRILCGPSLRTIAAVISLGPGLLRASSGLPEGHDRAGR